MDEAEPSGPLSSMKGVWVVMVIIGDGDELCTLKDIGTTVHKVEPTVVAYTGSKLRDHRPEVIELTLQDDRYKLAFADLKSLRVAVDQTLSHFDAPLQGVRELAFFPPMTGG